MRDPADLYEIHPGFDDVQGLAMLVCLDGFVDAGQTGTQMSKALFDSLSGEEIAVFDVDRLVDHRTRRPKMTFVENAWTDYTPHRIALSLYQDLDRQPFLVLHGPEPDLEWEGFCAAVQQLVEHFGITLSVSVSGIPTAVPHTRPISVTPHGTREELVTGHNSPLEGSTFDVPASVSALLEFRLGQAGRDFVGYAVHVPSYLAQTQYPRASVAATEFVAGATGLALPTDELEESAGAHDVEIAERVAESEEVQRVVTEYERRYDAMMSSRGDDPGDRTVLPLADDESGLPTADELGAELERFLAEREGDGNG
ncbi:PAC2 family protein [Nocardiopsis sp. HNM0947]|uniref:PAC2 family protein n=1 Tax=Nocardiopsis coralli TaxID=2772213 RepID=A0ABR9P0W7_9ACTN|nr:PAC2 family protein [Nocardiopsis coralli]MBE2997449.1 PAC2 family protein [Nocardiopsis coralli]